MQSWRNSLIALFLALIPHLQASAAILEVEKGILVGAKNVLIGNKYYDVEFQDTTCFEAYNGCDEYTDFAFFDHETVTLAGLALFEQVLIDGPLGFFDSMPNRVFGCDYFGDCAINTPFSEVDRVGRIHLSNSIAFNNRSIESLFNSDFVFFNSLNPYFDHGNSITGALAVWSQSVLPPTPVPLSPTALYYVFTLSLLLRLKTYNQN